MVARLSIVVRHKFHLGEFHRVASMKRIPFNTGLVHGELRSFAVDSGQHRFRAAVEPPSTFVFRCTVAVYPIVIIVHVFSTEWLIH